MKSDFVQFVLSILAFWTTFIALSLLVESVTLDFMCFPAYFCTCRKRSVGYTPRMKIWSWTSDCSLKGTSMLWVRFWVNAPASSNSLELLKPPFCWPVCVSCTYVPVYLCIWVSVRVYICVCVYLCIFVSVYLCICVSAYLCICVSACLCICVSVHLCISLSVYLVSRYLCICISAHLCICVSG